MTSTGLGTFQFEKTSATLGPVKMSATIIHSGTQHNVVPDVCEFVVDVRTTDAYSNLETLAIIKKHVQSTSNTTIYTLKPFFY